MADRQITWRGTVLGRGSPYAITKIEGWQGLPDMRVSNSDRPGRHGQYPGSMRASGRVITVTYRISDHSGGLPDAVDALEAALAPDENPAEEQLRISWDGTTRMVMARCEGHQLTMDPRWPTGSATGTIRWTATDPRRYGMTLHSDSCELPAPVSSGLAFPLAFPLAFGPGTSGGVMVASNAGGAAVWPVLLVDGPSTGPVITDLDTGRRLEFDPSFQLLAGQQLVIDTDSRSVLLGGVTRRNRLLTAEWFPIPAKSSVKIGFAAAAYDPAAQLIVQWRDTWL